MLYSSLDGREGPSVVLCGDARSVAVSGRLHPYNLIKLASGYTYTLRNARM